MAIPPVVCNSRVVEGLSRGVNATVLFDDENLFGIVQAYEFEYDRALARRYDVIASRVDYQESLPSGTLTLSGVVGPTNLPLEVCECIPHTIELFPGDTYCANGAPSPSYTFTDCLPMKFVMRGAISPELVIFNIVYAFMDVQNSYGNHV